MKKREDANYNQKAIKAVFGQKARLRAIINQAIEQMEDCMDEDTSFEEALAQFSYDFDSLAAEAAAMALGVDLTHYYIRTSSQMESGDVHESLTRSSSRTATTVSTSCLRFCTAVMPPMLRFFSGTSSSVKRATFHE